MYAESGYHGAATRKIAAAAGVNEITLFRHFGSKDVLLREALAQCQGEHELSLPEEPSDPLRELTEWSTAHLQHLHERAPLIRTCLGEFTERPDLVTPEISCPVRAAGALAGYLGRLKQRGLAAETGRPLTQVTNDIRAGLARFNLPPGYEITYGGESQDQAEVFTRIFTALGVAVLLMYQILVVQFGSFLDPLAILVSLPLFR